MHVLAIARGINDNVWVLALASAVGFAMPIVFAAIGEILCERSGVVNLGVEGMLLVGVVATFLALDATDNTVVALSCGVVAGGLLSLIHAFVCITMRANQTVSGLALVIFGTGLARFIGDPVEGKHFDPRFSEIRFPGFSKIPVLGPVLFQHDALVYVSVAIAAAVAFYINRTRPGLSLRAVGESPATADAQGISVAKVRYAHVLLGGLLAGLGGAYIVLAQGAAWNQDKTTGGIGWIALAVVVFASWRPARVLVGAIAFGFALRANFTLQSAEITWFPAEVLSMLPYLMTIVVLISVSIGDRRGRLGGPAALGRPFVRDER
jgi:simple sugar transport system permease protein